MHIRNIVDPASSRKHIRDSRSHGMRPEALLSRIDYRRIVAELLG